MGLFGFGKEEKTVSNCCGAAGEAAETCREPRSDDSGIKVLGAGCRSCGEQLEYVKAAVKDMGLDKEVAYVTDMEQVMAYGVMRLPAIVADGKVVSMGRVLKTDDVKKLFAKLGY